MCYKSAKNGYNVQRSTFTGLDERMNVVLCFTKGQPKAFCKITAIGCNFAFGRLFVFSTRFVPIPMYRGRNFGKGLNIVFKQNLVRLQNYIHLDIFWISSFYKIPSFQHRNQYWLRWENKKSSKYKIAAILKKSSYVLIYNYII